LPAGAAGGGVAGAGVVVAAALPARWARASAASSSLWLHRPSATGWRARMLVVFQWLRSRTAAIVGLVVPSSLEIWASDSSGWLRTSQAMPSGLSWRLAIGV
jgi:hypothetical protein